MAGLIIDLEKCIGCGVCVKGCSAGVLSVSGRKAVIGESCVLCGVCAQNCPVGAISIEKRKDAFFNIDEYHDVWVFAEQREQKVLPVVFELLGKGRQLADARGCRLCAVLAGGSGISKQAAQLFAAGADIVYLCEEECFTFCMEEPFRALLCKLIQELKPEIMLFGATDFGRSLAPRVAANSKTGLTADCTFLEIDSKSGLLRQTRPAFGGNLMATIICSHHRPQMATVRPGVMAAPVTGNGRTGKLIRVMLPEHIDNRVQVIETAQIVSAASIADAEILVVAGKGIGSSKNMKLIYELAELIGAQVGVSRAVVDAGWCDYSHQVGQTGFTVSPRLMLSFGVSGAIQHLAGITRTETLIAINNDPSAVIFNISRYAVVGDCVQVLNELIFQLRQDDRGSKQ